MSEQLIEVEGKVIAILPGTMFKVELKNNHVVLAHISGKLRKNFIKLTVGDKVKMEMSTHDLHKARIVFRLKQARSDNPEGSTPSVHRFPRPSRGR
jgi:translation initiation factor IF-1